MTTRTIRTLQTAQAAQPAQILSRPSRRKVLLGAATAAVGLTLAACSGKDSSGEKGGTTVTVVTHDSFVLPDKLIEANPMCGRGWAVLGWEWAGRPD